MSDRGLGRRTQLIIWAAAEARRLRGGAAPRDETAAFPEAAPAASPATASVVERRVIADVRSPVLDWQLPLDAVREQSR